MTIGMLSACEPKPI